MPQQTEVPGQRGPLSICLIEKVFLPTLTFLSLVAINPLGLDRGAIWTDPKTWPLTLWATMTWVLLLFYVYFSNSNKDRFLLQDQLINGIRLLNPFLLCFIGFVIAGYVAAIRSPFFLRAYLGQSTMGDGLPYWITVGALALGTTLLLAIRPKVFRYQLLAVIAAGVTQGLSVLPQAFFDWRLDYTVHAGLTQPNGETLLSSIWRGQMPIGLTSHRGHVAAILALTSTLVAGSYIKRPLRLWLLVFGVLTFSLWPTYTRGAYLALFAGLGSLFLIQRFSTNSSKRYYRIRMWANLVAVLVLSYGSFYITRQLSWVTINRDMPSFSLERPDTFSSGRIHLWQLAAGAILKNPLGYGFDGFGLAYPILKETAENTVLKILEINDYTFTYVDERGDLKVGLLPTNKAHNIILDLLISTGVLGAVLYLCSLFRLLSFALRSKENYLAATGIAYIVYGLTWFECAQYSHLAWWALAAGTGLFLSEKSRSRFIEKR